MTDSPVSKHGFSSVPVLQTVFLSPGEAFSSSPGWEVGRSNACGRAEKIMPWLEEDQTLPSRQHTVLEAYDLNYRTPR